ncbi:RDD family protein [Streptomyces flavofungini]|uniref:RDD family protein n=1 Tax=Streptomyces flavofungini TaxID=68200 RepID=UPI0034DF13D1
MRGRYRRAAAEDAGGVAPGGVADEGAGIVTRGVAAVVDALLLALAGFAVQVGAGCALLAVNGPPFRFPEFPVWLTGPVSWAFAVLYLGGSWAATGCSVGGRFMGLRVTGRRTDRPLGLPRSLVRAALCVTFPLGLCWIPFSARRASLQDLLAASRVRYEAS